MLRRALVAALLSSGIAAADEKRPEIAIEWRLLTAYVQGGLNNGYVVSCDDAHARKVQITVRPRRGAAVVREVACPREVDTGLLTVDAPGAGPFVVTARLPERRSARSERVEGVVPGDRVTVRIYVEGCDQPKCDRN